MDTRRIYVVVPRTVDSSKPPFKFTMTCGRMAAHACHVSSLIGATGERVADLDVIVLQVASSAALVQVQKSLADSSIAFAEYFDEDHAFTGPLLTAIATYPIEKANAGVLSTLKPWRCACNE